MVERNLGEVVLTTPTGPQAALNASPSALPTRARASAGHTQPPGIETNSSDNVTQMSDVEATAAAAVAAVLEAVVEGMARSLENGGDQGPGVSANAGGDGQARHRETTEEVPQTTVFRCGLCDHRNNRL